MKKIKSQLLSDAAKEELQTYIRANYVTGDNKLPTEERLAEMLGVSRITVRTALNDLANEGLVFRRQGKGTFVNQQALNIKVPFSPVILFDRMIELGGYQPSAKTLEITACPAGAPAAKLLEIEVGEELIMVRKMFYANEAPCAYCVDHFPARLLRCPDDIRHIPSYTNSLFDFLAERCGRKISWDRVEILTASAGEMPEAAEAFACGNPAKSYLCLEQVNFGGDDRPVLLAREYIDTHYIRFNSIRPKRI